MINKIILIFKTFILLVLFSLPAAAQTIDTLAFQDFEVAPATPTWNFSGPVVYNSGTSSVSAAPANSPVGIGGSRAWETTTNSGGLVLTFDNVVIPSGYDSIRVHFNLAAFNLVSVGGGPDNLDYVRVEYSIDGGTNYSGILRIRGALADNSYWAYDATGVASVYYLPASETTFQPVNTGLATTEGYSNCEIVFPGTVTQVQVRITGRSSSSTDTWMIDNVVITGESASEFICYNTAPPAFTNLTLPSGGSGNYAYEWEVSTNSGGLWSAAPGTNNQQDYQSPALTESSLFRRKVTDVNCSQEGYSNEISVTVNPELVLSAIPTDATCGSSNGEIDLTVTGGQASYTYAWDNSEITEDLTGLGAGTYIVVVTDANLCTATTSATVDNLDITPPTAVCQNITVQLDGTGNATIAAAQIDNGSSDLCGIASLTLDVTAFDCSDAGTNTVVLTVTDNNSNTATCTATVTVEDNVAPQAVCQNITIQLDASGNASLTGAQVDDGSSDACGIASLSVSPNTFNCTDVGANTVTLTVTDNNSNTATCTATVTVESILAVDITVDNAISCNGASDGELTAVVSGGGGTYTYAWSNSGSTPTITALPANTYTITVTDDTSGCEATDTETLNNPAGLTGGTVKVDP